MISNYNIFNVFYLKIILLNNKIKNYNIAQIGERIRDIKYDSKNNSLLMILENIPSLGIIYFN